MQGNSNYNDNLISSATDSNGQSHAYGRQDSSTSHTEQRDTHLKHFKAKTSPFRRSYSYEHPHHSSQPESFLRHHSSPNSNRNQELQSSPNIIINTSKILTPFETKIEKFINAVKTQTGITGQLVLLQTEEDSPAVALENAVYSHRSILDVQRKENNMFELTINGEIYAKGIFPNKRFAKDSLCEITLNSLRQKCFSVIKKKHYEEVSAEDIRKEKKDIPSTSMEGSKAHLMMLKMGWKGKGLGLNEQGSEKSVAETLTQNVTKAGLGGENVMFEIRSILEKFANSTRVTTLAFDSGFTKEERAHIHQMATQLNLKSRSEGKGDNRRITISKKIAKWDLVKELLLVDCENDSYKLFIPSEFESLWSE